MVLMTSGWSMYCTKACSASSQRSTLTQKTCGAHIQLLKPGVGFQSKCILLQAREAL